MLAAGITAPTENNDISWIQLRWNYKHTLLLKSCESPFAFPTFHARLPMLSDSTCVKSMQETLEERSSASAFLASLHPLHLSLEI